MSVKLRFQENKDGVKSYYLHINSGGRRTKEFLDIKIYPDDPKKHKDELLRKANILRANREGEILSGITGITSPKLQNKAFKPFAESYLNKYTKKNINTVRGAINMFYAFAGEAITMQQITPTLMEDFMDYLKDSHLTGETPHNYWSKFKMVLRRAKKEGYFRELPTDGIIFKGREERNLRKQILDDDDLRVLKATRCGNDQVKRAFIFACFTGLGMAEIRNLKWGDIHQGRLYASREKTGTDIGKKLSPTALEMIGTPGHKEDFVFDIHISDTAVNKNIRNWVKRANLNKDITFYCARHTFAVLTLNTGANLKTVADLMGHTKVETTARYLNYLKGAQDKAIDNLPTL
jgi:integrase